VPMDALGVDVARGGQDRTVLTARHGAWFGAQHVFPGSATPDGPTAAALAIKYRIGNAAVNVDVIGVGTSVVDSLKATIGERAVPINGSAGSEARDHSGQLGFLNLRAEIWWKLREALDPQSGQDLAIPNDPELRADLCAPKWKLSARGVQVEGKEDLIKRLGRSPDKGESLLYASALRYFAGAGVFEYIRGAAENAGVRPAAGASTVPAPAPETVRMRPPRGASGQFICGPFRIDVGDGSQPVDVPLEHAMAFRSLKFIPVEGPAKEQ
jgi:hypothetical protein